MQEELKFSENDSYGHPELISIPENDWHIT